MRRAVGAGALVVALSACGHASTPSSSPAGRAFVPGAFEPSLRVAGSLPGRRVAVRAPRAVVRSSVRELLATGRGAERLPLYVGRDGARRLCIGTTRIWECLRPIDARPVFAFTLQGGHGPIRDHGAIVGLAAPDVRVTVDVANHEVPLRLRRYRRFAWAAFSLPLTANRAPDTLNFYERDGTPLSGFLDLAFSANPCNRKRTCAPHGLWHAIGDPWGDASGAPSPLVERARRIAFADPLVRRLLAERRYSFDPTGVWSKCSGGTIGAVLDFVIGPATFTADWPMADYDAKSHTAYVERTVHFRVSNVTQLEVSVDVNRRRVVGVDPTSSAAIAGPDPKIDYFTYRRVGKAVPAGGLDRGNCSTESD